jgi:V-type H+-transporting ATPase subunit E
LLCIDRSHSTLTNKSRLKLLHLREQHLQDLFQTSRDDLASLSSSSQYVQFLEGVIVQGFLQLLEEEVLIHVREKDVHVATKAAHAAARQYLEISGRHVKFEVVPVLSAQLYALLCDLLNCF